MVRNFRLKMMTLVSNVHPVRRITISCIAAYSHFMRIVAYSLRQEFIRGTSKNRKEFIRGNWQMLGVSPLAGAGTVASDWQMIPSS
jgi:hypothetical protein